MYIENVKRNPPQEIMSIRVQEKNENVTWRGKRKYEGRELPSSMCERKLLKVFARGLAKPAQRLPLELHNVVFVCFVTFRFFVLLM